MAKSKRGNRGGKRKQRAVAKAAAGKLDVQNFGAAGSWDGAGVSPRRGMIVWPTLDSRKELPPRARKEIIKRARWADSNVGLAIRAIDGPANLIGNLTPQSVSGDPAWSKEAEEVMRRRFDNPLAFDRAGELDFFGWQDAITRGALRDGDTVTALLEAKAGGGAQVLLYGAHQVDNGRADKVPGGLRDGVFSDKMGRPLGYRLINADDATKFRTLPANAAIFHSYKKHGSVRGVSSVAHAISNILDIVEILADSKHGIKVANQWGVALETAPGAVGDGGVGEELAAFLGNGDNESADKDANDALFLDSILQGGRMQSTPAGSKITTLSDDRPHPNQLNLLRWLVRDVAWGLGLSPEVLWELAGLNGTATRYLMAETRKWVRRRQRRLAMSCQRLWTYAVSREIKAGRLRQPTTDRWWMCKWIPEADPTIDVGRDGKLELEQLDNNALTYQEYFAKRGQDWETEFEQMKKEKARMDQLFGKVSV